MSIQSEIERINNNVQSTLQTIAATGVEVGSNSDALPAAAAALANEKLSLSGGTMTGPLVLAADPAEDMQAATKKYVDSVVAQGGGESESESRLPDGYTELQYIQSTGTQYIDTGFAPDQDTRAVMDMELTAAGVMHLFGARTAGASNSFFVANLSATQIRADYATQQQTFTVDSVLNRTTIDFNKNAVTMFNQSKSFTAATFTPNVNIGLFGSNTNGTVVANTYKAKMRMYSCQIYDNGTKVRDYVPCTNADGVCGLYDLVNSQFYGNAGSGNFTAGPEVTGHARTHSVSGSDPITPAMIGAPTVAEMNAAIYSAISGAIAASY